MFKDLMELNDFVISFSNQVVREACEQTSTGQYFINVEDVLDKNKWSYEDFLEYKDFIISELSSRDEILDLDFDEKELQFDVSCALAYCPHYEWCEGDEELFECSYEEWLERPVEPVQIVSVKNSLDGETKSMKEMYFTVRDGFGDDIAETRYSKFDDAAEALKKYCSLSNSDAEGAVLGLVYKDDERSFKAVLAQNHFYPSIGYRFKSMSKNIDLKAMDIPEIELAVLKAKQLQHPFCEVTQGRIDALEKMLGVYEREVRTDGDLYVGNWRVHIVEPGGRYGVNNNVVNRDNESLVEFWDMSVQKATFPDGQFVSRYGLETLLEDKWGPGPDDFMRGGLCLDADVPSWSVSSDDMKTFYSWLKIRDLQPGEHYVECFGEVDVPHGLMDNVPLPHMDSAVMSGEVILHQRLDGIAGVRDMHVEQMGEYKAGIGYTFSFKSQANQAAIKKAVGKVLDGMKYNFELESKTVDKESLDKVINECSSKVKKGTDLGEKSKNRDLEI